MERNDRPDHGHHFEVERALVRFIDSQAGPLPTETARAASSTTWFAIFCATLSAGYGVFYATYDAAGLWQLITITCVAFAAHLTGAVLARLGHQLVAAVLVLSLTYAQIIASSIATGWESGVHLYLIAAGLVVFAVFTERQRLYRWVFVALAGGAFVACQVLFPATSATITIPPGTLAAIMSVSAVVTALLVYFLAAVAHYRAGQNRSHAVAHAARAQYLANTDMLTGLANRRPIMDKLHRESAKGVGGFCVAIADLDRFKELNDAFGHACGDQVLSVVGEVLKSQLGAKDSLGRWGGEEFIFVLPETDLSTAVTHMEHVRAAIEAAVIVCGDHSHRVTSSFGVADGADDGAPHRVVKRADDALYDAKMAGRNAVFSRAYEVGLGGIVPTETSPGPERRSRKRRSADRTQDSVRP